MESVGGVSSRVGGSTGRIAELGSVTRVAPSAVMSGLVG